MTDSWVRWFNASIARKPKPQQNYEIAEALEQMNQAAEKLWLFDGTNFEYFVACDKSYQAARDRYLTARKEQ